MNFYILLIKEQDIYIEKDIIDKKDESEIEAGRPLEFDKDDKHSFLEWLKLTELKTVESNLKSDSVSDSQSKRFKLIDNFIENNPKIIPISKDNNLKPYAIETKLDKTELMTETLARVYTEQKKYKKAIQSYKILCLKYPEKSTFFASQIKAIKELQKNNKS